jgi:hypothetical protein
MSKTEGQAVHFGESLLFLKYETFSEFLGEAILFHMGTAFQSGNFIVCGGVLVKW